MGGCSGLRPRESLTPERRGCFQHLLWGHWPGVSGGGVRLRWPPQGAGLQGRGAPRCGLAEPPVWALPCPWTPKKWGGPGPSALASSNRHGGLRGTSAEGVRPPGAVGLGQSTVQSDRAPGVGSGAVSAALPCPSLPRAQFPPRRRWGPPREVAEDQRGCVCSWVQEGL